MNRDFLHFLPNRKKFFTGGVCRTRRLCKTYEKSSNIKERKEKGAGGRVLLGIYLVNLGNFLKIHFSLFTVAPHKKLGSAHPVRVIEFWRISEFSNWYLMRGGLMLPDSIFEEKLKIDRKMEDLQAGPFWCRLFWGHKRPAPEWPSL